MKQTRTIPAMLATIVLVSGAAFSTGCDSDAKTGALIGSGVGAAAGAAIDSKNRGRGALIGAGVGGAGGYIVGNERDKSKTDNY